MTDAPPASPEDETAEPVEVPPRKGPPPLPRPGGTAAEVRSLERHVCPECGGKGEWSAAKKKLVCPYCGTEFARVAPPPLPDITEHDLDAMLARLGDKATTVDTKVRKVKCTHCHAILERSGDTVAQSCDFCGSPELLDYEDIEAPIRPESLLPAVVSKQEAYQALKQFLSSKWLAPNDLKRKNWVDRIHGIYLPYWTFDSAAECPWTADSGTYYYVTVRDRGPDGKVRRRQERRTRWRPARGHVSTWFDDIAISGSHGMQGDLLRRLEPFPLKELTPYETRFVSGWEVEQYQVPLLDAARQGFGVMQESLRGMCAREVPGDTYRNLRISPAYSGKTFKHVLVPVWLVSYRYRGKLYQGGVNAVTRETYAKSPLSPWKIMGIVVAILIIVIMVLAFLAATQA